MFLGQYHRFNIVTDIIDRLGRRSNQEYKKDENSQISQKPIDKPANDLKEENTIACIIILYRSMVVLL